MNGVIKTATGDLLRAGFTDFLNDGSFDVTIETYRTDIPDNAKVMYSSDETQMHRWDGSSWILVSQPSPIIVDSSINIYSGDGTKWKVTVDDIGILYTTKVA